MNDRDLALIIELGKAQIIHRANVEIAAVTGAGQVKLRHACRCEAGLEWIVRAGDLTGLIVLDELTVGHQQAGPSPRPFVGDGELARGLNGAAERLRGRAIRSVTAREVTRIGLENSRGPDRVRAGEQALPPFAVEQRALFSREQRPQRQIGIGCERPKIFRPEAKAILRRAPGYIREQEAALPLHGRIRRRQKREIGDRDAEEFDAGVLEIDHLLALVMDDPGRLYLPQRWLLRIVLTGFAGGIDAVLQDGVVAF